MDSRRQQKISHLIQEAFSEVLQKDGAAIYGARVLVTITKVSVTPDMSLARIYLSIFNTKEPDEVILQMEGSKSELRRSLGNKLRHSLRKIPELEFFRDDTLDYVEKMENIFKEIKKDKPEDQAD